MNDKDIHNNIKKVLTGFSIIIYEKSSNKKVGGYKIISENEAVDIMNGLKYFFFTTNRYPLGLYLTDFDVKFLQEYKIVITLPAKKDEYAPEYSKFVLIGGDYHIDSI